MKALRFEKKELNLADINKPDLPGEALVRVLKSGICNTDLEIVRGYAGFEGTIGHEFVGIVEKADGADDLVGKRVVGEINAGCDSCAHCEGNDSRHCPNRTVLGIIGRDGAHAEFLNLPVRNLRVVPDTVSDSEAVFAEPLAAAIAIAERVDISQETKIAVIGDGKLGNLCAQYLRTMSQNTTLIGKHPEKLRLVENRGVEGVLLEKAKKLPDDFDVVIEASGSESGFSLALDLLKPRGKLVMKSTFQGKTNVEMWRLVVNEISIIGSRCGRLSPALSLLADKTVFVENLISEEIGLKNGVAAIEKAGQKGVMKIILSNEW